MGHRRDQRREHWRSTIERSRGATLLCRGYGGACSVHRASRRMVQRVGHLGQDAESATHGRDALRSRVRNRAGRDAFRGSALGHQADESGRALFPDGAAHPGRPAELLAVSPKHRSRGRGPRAVHEAGCCPPSQADFVAIHPTNVRAERCGEAARRGHREGRRSACRLDPPRHVDRLPDRGTMLAQCPAGEG